MLGRTCRGRWVRHLALLAVCLLACLPEQGAALQKESAKAETETSSRVGLAAETRSLLSSAVRRTHETLHVWLHPLSAAAIATTIALQLSPMPSCLEIRKDRSVKRYDGYPYFTVLAGATQWCIYGTAAAVSSGDLSFLTMVAANGPGIGFGIFYVSTFLGTVSPGDQRYSALKRYLYFGLALLIAEAISAMVYRSATVYWLGLLGSVGSAQIALSPFKTLPEVVATRSTRSWPLDLCLWNFIQSAATGGFGFANDDPWVWVPNVIGVAAALVQLFFVVLFWAPAKQNSSAAIVFKDTVLPQKAAACLENYGAFA